MTSPSSRWSGPAAGPPAAGLPPAGGAASCPAALPLLAFPKFAADYVQAVAAELEVSPSLVGVLVLGAMATALTGKVAVQVRERWLEPVHLFLLNVAHSGEGKSAAHRAAFAVGWAWEKDARRQHEAEREALLSESVVAGCVHGPEIVDEMARLLRKQDEEGTSIRLFADDTTPEKLAELMANCGGRIAIASPEAHGFFGRAAGLDLYLKAHSGEPISVDRIGRGSLHIARPALMISLCAQPDVLIAAGKNKKFRKSGLLARFLIAAPESRLGTRTHAGSPVPAAIASRHAFMMSSLFDSPSPLPDEEIPVIRLDAQAAARMRQFQRELEPRLTPGRGDLAPIADWVSKLPGNTARIAGILHCAQRAGNLGLPHQGAEAGSDLSGRAIRLNPAAESLTVETLDNAILLARFFLDHARRTFDAIDGRDENDRTIFVLERIFAIGKEEVPTREILRKCRTVLADEMKGILRRLVERGDLIELHGRGRGRRYRVVRAEETPPPGDGGGTQAG